MTKETSKKAYMITNEETNRTGIVSGLDEKNVSVTWDDNEEVTSLTNEAFKELLESKKYSVEEVELSEEGTPAQQSIVAHSSPDPKLAGGGEADGNPKTKFDWIRMIVGNLADMDMDSLTKIFNDQQSMIGGEGSRAGLDGKSDGNKDSIDMKPSAAVGRVQGSAAPAEHGLGESALPKLQKEAQDQLFAETELTEEAKTKFTSLFESAVAARLAEEIVNIQEQYETALEQNVATLTTNLVESINDYLGHVAQDWAEENKIAIESALRSTLTLEFANDLQELFNKHNIEVPEDKVNVVEALVAENEELKAQLNQKVNEDIQQAKVVKDLQKKEIVTSLSEGLTLVQQTKLRQLLESVDFEDQAKFTDKASVIKKTLVENKAPVKIVETTAIVGANNVQTEVLTEDANTQVTTDPRMLSVLAALDRTVVKH